MSERTLQALQRLEATLEEAIAGWREYTGECDGMCEPDWLCQALPAMRERVKAAIQLAIPPA